MPDYLQKRMKLKKKKKVYLFVKFRKNKIKIIKRKKLVEKNTVNSKNCKYNFLLF